MNRTETYTGALSEADRLAAEEWIGATLFDESELNELECQDLGQRILLEILSRFRPDLVTSARAHSKSAAGEEASPTTDAPG